MNEYIENSRQPFRGLSSLFYIDVKLLIPIILITIIGLILNIIIFFMKREIIKKPKNLYKQ